MSLNKTTFIVIEYDCNQVFIWNALVLSENHDDFGKFKTKKYFFLLYFGHKYCHLWCLKIDDNKSIIFIVCSMAYTKELNSAASISKNHNLYENYIRDWWFVKFYN